MIINNYSYDQSKDPQNINIVSKEDVPGFEALVVITALFLFAALTAIRRRK